MKTLSIIIACYNEEKNIASTIERIYKVVPHSEIIIVDDGSSDDTRYIAAKTARCLKIKRFKIIFYKKNKGKGYAIKQGVLSATGYFQAQVDADCQFQPEELPALLKPLYDEKADITFCSRFCKGASYEDCSVTKIRRVANFVVSTLVSLLSGRYLPNTWLTDINAGFKAWVKTAIDDIDFKCPHFGYEGEIAILAYKKNYSIVEVPINYKKRLEGETNVKLIKDGIIIPLYFLKTWLFR